MEKMVEIKKHAYLLMVHHRKDLLDLLIEELDDERNDIYIHIDTKSDLKFNDFHTNKAKLYETERIDVNWGGFSQIKCEYILMKAARKNGPYAYYHLMQGSSYPLKTQDELHKFYDEHQGKLFITVRHANGKRNINRAKQIWLFNEVYHSPLMVDFIKRRINSAFRIIQDIVGYDRFKKYNMKICKGFALWSITEDFLDYLLEKEELVNEIFKYSCCGDELFIQTMAYNSKYRDRLFYNNNNVSLSMWTSTWPIGNETVRPGCNFKYEDLNFLLNNGNNFARKFEGDDGIKLIEEIKKELDKRR